MSSKQSLKSPSCVHLAVDVGEVVRGGVGEVAADGGEAVTAPQ